MEDQDCRADAAPGHPRISLRPAVDRTDADRRATVGGRTGAGSVAFGITVAVIAIGAIVIYRLVGAGLGRFLNR
jgi:hypothetical protein